MKECGKSLNFVGTIGETVSAADFPRENYLIDDSRYDAEGDWAFCRFGSNEVYAARLGFTRGSYDFADFGYVPASSESYLLVHLHLMTREGAVLWTATGRFRAEQVTSDCNEMDVQLLAGEKVFRIQGWPHMRWHFRSDDGRSEADLEFDLANATILPDNILPGNVFSMWESIGQVRGTVRYGGKTTPVSGTVFYDHSRFKIQSNAVPPRQWHLYTPMFFKNESVIISYYTVDHTGTCVEDYSFGLYIDVQGNSRWLPKATLSDLKLDNDGLPKAWRLRFSNQGFNLEADISVKSTSILEAWGAWGTSMIPKARKDFGLIPLVLDGIGAVSEDDTSHTIQGYGLAEYWRMPEAK
jgi:hypothetical protein